MLATVLFTDIVGSTEQVAELGDAGWRELVERHHATVRARSSPATGGGRSTPPGTGSSPASTAPRGRCAAPRRPSRQSGRWGSRSAPALHTGEVETIAGKVGGIAVAIGARVGALARPSEVLVSQTVKDLVAGSGLAFEDRGVHELKGVPGEWRLYVVAG